MYTKWLPLACLLALIHSHWANAQTAADTIINHVHLIPMSEERVLYNQALVIEKGRIKAIVQGDDVALFTAREHIDGQGAFVIPGLADMHVHLRMDPQAMFNLLLANGVTTVTNARLGDGDGKFSHVALKRAVAAGEMLGPRYLVSGPQLKPAVLPDLKSVEPMLDRHVAQGFDVVKIHGDLPFSVYDALIKGAKARGLRVTGHAQHQMPWQQSLRMSSMEHAEEFLYTSLEGFGPAADDFLAFQPMYYKHVASLERPGYRKDMVAAFASAGIYLDPTLIIYRMIGLWADDAEFAKHKIDPLLRYVPKGTRNWYLGDTTNPYREDGFPLSAEHLHANLRRLQTVVLDLHQTGVPLLLGTDSFGTLVPGFSIHDELALLVAAGLSPFEALRTGTVNVASYLQEAEHAGTLAVGKRADLVLLEGNPLQDITQTRNVLGVYTHRRWHNRAKLDAMLAYAEAQAERDE